MSDQATTEQAPATASLSLSAGSGQFTIAGGDATLAGANAKLERLRAIGAEQAARRDRRDALRAELEQLRVDGLTGEAEAAPLFVALAGDPSRAEELESLRHKTAYPL